MTPFSTWLRAQMQARGIDNRQLAQALTTLNDDKRIGDSTVHDWLEQGALPTVRSVVLLSRYFQVSTDTVIRLVGYDVVVSDDDAERNARRAELLARLPRFAEIAEKLARQPAEKQDAYLSVIERLLPLDD